MRDRAIILFPFERVEKGSRVVIYGSADIAQAYYWELKKSGYAEVVAWTDREWEKERVLEAPRMHIDAFKEMEYDYVVVGINDRDECIAAKEYLESIGVVSAKIIIADEVLHFNVENLRTYAEKKLRIGFIATGAMAHTMALTISDQCKGVELYAVASRQSDKAESFKKKYGFAKSYGSYDELIEDSQVDVVYISTPVKYHYNLTVKALNHGKHVICEKPMAVNFSQTREMINLAKEKKLFLTDGVWTAYLPMAKYIPQLMNHPEIGKVHMISANLHFPSLSDKRLTDYDMCGGQLLESGYYLAEFLDLLIGKDPEDMNVYGQLWSTGVDFQTIISLKYSKDLMANFSIGLGSVCDLVGYVYGEKGMAMIKDANQFKQIVIFNSVGEIVYKQRHESGYWYEIDACVEAINFGKTETRERPHEIILRDTLLLEGIRKRAGVQYKEDGEYL